MRSCAGIFKQQSTAARNRVGTGFSHWPARLHSLVELDPWNRFLGSLKAQKFGLCILKFLGTGRYYGTPAVSSIVRGRNRALF
jgi:hypothetical protein